MATVATYFSPRDGTHPETVQLLAELIKPDDAPTNANGMLKLGFSQTEIASMTGTSPKELDELFEGRRLPRETERLLSYSCYAATLLLRQHGDPAPVTELMRQEWPELSDESMVTYMPKDRHACLEQASRVAIDLFNQQIAI